MKKIVKFGVTLILIIISITGFSQNKQEIMGKWTLLPAKSSSIGLYKTLQIEVHQEGDKLMLIQQWGRGRSYSDSLTISANGKVKIVQITNRVFPSNVFMGLSMPVGATKKVSAVWEGKGTQLKVVEKYKVHGSQGLTPVVVTHIYQLSKTKELLEYTISRSTREENPAMKYILKPAGTRNAYYMNIDNDWTIDGNLPEKAFLISLQGIVNLTGPKLYFIYPDNYPFTYTKSVFEFYRDKRYYTFTELKTAGQALAKLKQNVKGYVGSVLNMDELNQLADTIQKEWKSVDILINAAGGNLPGATLEPDQEVFDMKIEDFNKVTDLNLNGTVYPTLAFGKVMARQGSGSIINVSSMATYSAITRVPGYSVAKTGINIFTMWMATEMARKYGDKVRVNAIAPGFFIGDQNRSVLINPDGSLTDRIKKVIAKTPMGRFGDINELNGAVQFLCSGAASFITGVVLPVDGGFSAFSGV